MGKESHKPMKSHSTSSAAGWKLTLSMLKNSWDSFVLFILLCFNFVPRCSSWFLVVPETEDLKAELKTSLFSQIQPSKTNVTILTRKSNPLFHYKAELLYIGLYVFLSHITHVRNFWTYRDYCQDDGPDINDSKGLSRRLSFRYLFKQLSSFSLSP